MVVTSVQKYNSLPARHLHVYPKNNPEFVKEVAFREFIMQNKEYADQLSKLKWALAEKYDNEQETYMKGKMDRC